MDKRVCIRLHCQTFTVTKPLSQYSTFDSQSACCNLIVFSESTILSALYRENLCCCSAESGTRSCSHYSVKLNSLQPNLRGERQRINPFVQSFNAQQRSFSVFSRCLITSLIPLFFWVMAKRCMSE